jgi:UDP-glucose 4-epimerase
MDFWRKLGRDPSRLEVLGDGKQRKSYLHVHDCVRAMLLAVDKAEGPINVFNLGHDESIVVNESIGIITRTLGVTPRLEFTGGARGWVGDSPRIELDIARIRTLGWAPTKTIEDAIVETLHFLTANPFTQRRA